MKPICFFCWIKQIFKIMRRMSVGMLCVCLVLLLCSSCECVGSNDLCGTWRYDSPEWHGMSTHHEMSFDKNSEFCQVVKYSDMGIERVATISGRYEFDRLDEGRLCLYDRLYDGLYQGTDTTWMRVSVRGNRLYIYESELSDECVVYKRK